MPIANGHRVTRPIFHPNISVDEVGKTNHEPPLAEKNNRFLFIGNGSCGSGANAGNDGNDAACRRGRVVTALAGTVRRAKRA